MKSSELYRKAKTIIPGGTQLLSKRPEMFLPELWPSYYSKAKGVEVWDLDGNKYIDMSITAIGACPLGYADDEVNEAVKKAVDNASMTTLNCPEEVELAELLFELHPWADMVRYARTGGEAMAIAVRIARAATGRDKVAFCGYHGWHDWYLAANLSDNRNLDGHLLPGLKPKGVPRALLNTAFPFRYNHPEELDELVEKHGNDLAALVMEPVRHHQPEEGFLEHVKDVAKKAGAVLIFDEITSGWRMNVGGIHLIYGVEPDIAVFAKAISNGFPMAAIIGKKDVMDAAQESFISSTYWTERIGPVAAIATIKKMKRESVPEHLIEIGNLVQQGWKELAKTHDLPVKVEGIPPLSVFQFDHPLKLELQTLFTQLMLERGFLASKGFYATFAHQREHVQIYLEAVDEVFKKLREALESNSIHALLKGPVVQTGFKRLN